MDEINKKQFLDNFEGEFEGNDENGYIYKGFLFLHPKLEMQQIVWFQTGMNF